MTCELPFSPAMSLILRRANVSRKSGTWQHEDYDVFDGERDVGRIYRLDDRPDSAWFWGVSFELTRRSKGPRTKSLEPRISLAASP
jgi:hypothetical protein